MAASQGTTRGGATAPRDGGRRRAWWAVVGLLAGAAAALVAVTTAMGGGATPAGRCAPRVIALDPSSSVDVATWDTAVQLIEVAGRLAAVCDTPLYVAAAVPGHTVSILTTDDLQPFVPEGPNTRVRASRFTDGDADGIAAIVHDRLAAAVGELPADRSDLVALLAVAADRSSPDTEVIVVSDGVHHDDAVDLDRPLAAGEGADLAAKLRPATVAARRVRVVGVGEVDAVAAAPSSVWVSEVRAFVTALCQRTGTVTCEVRGAASVSEVLS